MKKLLTIALLAIGVVGLSGCSQEDKDEVKDVPGAGSAPLGGGGASVAPNGGSGQVQSASKPEAL